MLLENVIEKPSLVYVRVDQIEPMSSAGRDTIELATSSVPALRDCAALTPLALQWIAHLHPPLLWRQQRGARRFHALGNLRTIELCRQLPADTRVPALVIAVPKSVPLADVVNASHCLSTISHGLDLRFANQSLLQLIKLSNRELLLELSQNFANRSSIEQWLGLNRRLKLPSREYASSAMSQAELPEAKSND